MAAPRPVCLSLSPGSKRHPHHSHYYMLLLLHAIACYFGYLWHGIFVANLRLQRPGFMQLISRPGLWNLGPRLSAAMSCDLPRPSEAPAGPSLAVAAPASLMVFFLAGPSCKASRNFNDIYMITYIYIIIYIYLIFELSWIIWRVPSTTIICHHRKFRKHWSGWDETMLNYAKLAFRTWRAVDGSRLLLWTGWCRLSKVLKCLALDCPLSYTFWGGPCLWGMNLSTLGPPGPNHHPHYLASQIPRANHLSICWTYK